MRRLIPGCQKLLPSCLWLCELYRSSRPLADCGPIGHALAKAIVIGARELFWPDDAGRRSGSKEMNISPVIVGKTLMISRVTRWAAGWRSEVLHDAVDDVAYLACSEMFATREEAERRGAQMVLLAATRYAEAS